MLNVFGDIESFMSELYPYRFAITPLLAMVAAGALLVAYRAGLHVVLLRHRLTAAAVGVPILVVSLVAGNYLLSPLWERTYLNEARPLEASAAGRPATSSGATPLGGSSPAAPTLNLKGMFKGADDFHFGRGDAQIIETPDGKKVLRFENFSVRNGPDLYVYLSADADGKRIEEALNLGRLKATAGAFNYDIPAGIDVGSVRSVVVWCRQFSVTFAVAPLG